MLTYLKLIWLRWRNRRLIAQLQRQRASHRAEIARLKAETEELIQEKADAIVGLVGALVLTWARLESYIDICVAVIHETWGRDEIQHDLPPSLDRELDYLKAAAAGWQFSEEACARLLALLPRIHSLKTYRHDFVHGVADLYDKGAIPVEITRVKGAFHFREAKRYTSDQFGRKMDAVQRLTVDFILFTEDLAGEFNEREDSGG